MLARLRHHGFIAGDDQQHAVDAADAREHRPHEPLVAGHVDEGDARVADRGVREPQLDGDAARFFFLETIGIDAGINALVPGLVDVPRTSPSPSSFFSPSVFFFFFLPRDRLALDPARSNRDCPSPYDSQIAVALLGRSL